jgi:hypothetical protein
VCRDRLDCAAGRLLTSMRVGRLLGVLAKRREKGRVSGAVSNAWLYEYSPQYARDSLTWLISMKTDMRQVLETVCCASHYPRDILSVCRGSYS